MYDNVDRDEDDEIDIMELDFALKAVNYDLISDAEMNYVHSVSHDDCLYHAWETILSKAPTGECTAKYTTYLYHIIIVIFTYHPRSPVFSLKSVWYQS